MGDRDSSKHDYSQGHERHDYLHMAGNADYDEADSKEVHESKVGPLFLFHISTVFSACAMLSRGV